MNIYGRRVESLEKSKGPNIRGAINEKTGFDIFQAVGNSDRTVFVYKKATERQQIGEQSSLIGKLAPGGAHSLYNASFLALPRYATNTGQSQSKNDWEVHLIRL